MRGPMQNLGVGPNTRSRRGAPLSSNFMKSSCSVNRVTIVTERRCKAHTRELSTFANVRRSSLLTMKFTTEFSSARCIWQKWATCPNKHHHGAGPQRSGAQCSCIGCIGLRPALVLMRALFASSEVYRLFLLNYWAQGVSGENEQPAKHHGSGSSEERGPM